MASNWTDAGRADLASNGVTGKTLRVLAVTVEPSAAAVQAAATVSAITAEVTAAGYARQTLSGVAVTVDSTNHRGRIAAADASFGSVASGATIVGFWVFRQVGGSPADASDIPWVYVDTADLATNGATMTAGLSSGFAAV